MALTTTASDIANFLETVYTPNQVLSLALKDAPLTTFLPKRQAAGENVVTRLLGAEMGGQGTTLAKAITAEKDPEARKVTLDYKKFYTAFSVENDALERSEKNSLVPMLKLTFDSSIRLHGDELETRLFGGRNGAIGQIATGGISSDTITLTDASDCFNFENGDILLFDNTATGASPKAGSAVVESVDYENGKITVVDITTVTGTAAAADYIFKDSFQNGAAPLGIFDWIPKTAPVLGSDSFGGFDRGINPTRYAGWRYPVAAGSSVKAAVIKSVGFGMQFGGRPEIALMSTNKMTDLLSELQNLAVWDAMESKELKVSFPGVKLMGPQGPILCVASPKCPEKQIAYLTKNTWELVTVGELIRNPVRNGKFVDAEQEDGIRGRWKTVYSLSCRAPGHNGQTVFA
jgi:hypothetical protein